MIAPADERDDALDLAQICQEELLYTHTRFRRRDLRVPSRRTALPKIIFAETFKSLAGTGHLRFGIYPPWVFVRSGMASKPPRRAHAVDANLKSRSSARLRRIEGQIRGVGRMVDEERY